MSSGRLVYVMGPSGAGKDSVLNEARRQLGGSPTAFAHRYITRPADAGGENHVTLSEEEFACRRDRSLFLFHWHSHGLFYGAGIELLDWMYRGFTVVLNGSREYWPQARERIPNIEGVLITARSEVLRQRLQDRGRESDAAIKERIRRNTALESDMPGVRVIDNSGDLSHATSELVDFLRKPAP
ncbi:phosphonate metabolism protein/1,5-bisphosphokinase (PRPP-forming) PhnN [Oceanidesulfovibrio marinus]|uniref:Ribose 1,5-bisphosphate phosphokinase PhnN n=1 Tax=Oceanidesulfovibrio marinus TaxID=370038 RepID=A0A6P1ZFM7_9BACT|nr:phosphonate metabolism protein/1,5-bisphosphokinase (PRPP-forming) PhnN [Oceanidesulfovibrio marinus]TVM33432.1 phosphonate metabolism protein/1,5-bisphosphokinase (PRPP-forming) PhnN [Oceanidesulfovibrio marinus]